MSLTTEMGRVNNVKGEAKDVIDALSQMAGGYQELVQRNQAIQNIVDASSFDTIPADLKAALVDLWGVFQAAQAAIEGNTDRTELVNFSPG